MSSKKAAATTVPVASPGSKFDLHGDPTEGQQRLQAIALRLGVEKGIHTASILDRAMTYQVKKIPTGIFLLDWYTGGGIPIDRITRIGGPKDSYKSTTLFKIMYHAQNFCRYCKSPLVIDSDGNKNCACPNPRYKLSDSGALQWMSYDDATAIIEGRLPSTVQGEKGKFWMVCNGKNYPLEETYRCAPFQTVFVETEHKMDSTWAAANGVDPSLVIVLGCDWAEKMINTVEQLIYTGEVDIVFVDTLSMMNTKDTIEKDMDQNEKVAQKARIKQRFLEKIIASQFSKGLLSDSNVTIVVNSQVRTKGIGSFRTHLGVSDGNCADHLVALDLYFRQVKFYFTHANYASEGEYEFTVKKNHTGGASGVSGTFKVWLDPCGERRVGESDDVEQVIKFGRQVGIITASENGGKYAIQKKSFATLDAIREFFESNRTQYNQVRYQVLEALKTVRTALPKKEKGAAE